jgi:hypothetical protein
LTLTDNGANSPQVISLSGAGSDFSFQPATGGLTSVTVNAGQTALYNLQIQANELQGTVTLSCAGAPAQATCRLSQNNFFFSPGSAPVPFQVQVSTIARSSVTPWRTGFRPSAPPHLGSLFILSVAIFSVLALVFFKRRPLRNALEILVLLGMFALLTVCGGGGGGGSGGGGGGGGSGTAAGTYAITLTGQFNSGTRAINLTLVVN